MIDMRTATLTHQSAAISKLAPLKVGALFAEMGTGKSRIFYDLALQKVQAGKASRVVVLCPVSGRFHLEAEARKHTSASVSVHGGAYRQPEANINIIGTESISSSITAINRLSDLCADAVVVVDESHQIKNRDAKRTKRIWDVTRQARYRYISTGTPVSNGVEDLWSQCWFLHWKVLGYRSFNEFKRHHLRHEGDACGRYGEGRITGRFNTKLLADKMAPYTFEARKADCLDLPEKTYSFRTAQMTPQAEQIYQMAKAAILCGKDAFDADDATIFRLFTALQMLACGQVPAFVAKALKMPDLRLPRPKEPVLLDVLADIPRASKTVVWCKYLAEADSAAQTLQAAGYAVCRMDGRMGMKDRHAHLERLRTDADVLVATTATGGQVLDIGFADYAVYLSNGFDYLQRAQSEDRLHRLGMTGAAHYIDIFTECGVERRIQRSLARKENAARAFADKVRQLRAERRIDEAQEVMEAL